MDGVVNILVQRNLSKMRPKLDEFADVVPGKTFAHVNHFYPSILIHGQVDFPLFVLGGFEDERGDVFWLVPCNHGESHLALPARHLIGPRPKKCSLNLVNTFEDGWGDDKWRKVAIVCELRIDFTSTP